MAHTHRPARRRFLRLSARLAALGLAGLGLDPWRRLFPGVSAAPRATDYKALVCVYLFGGNDSSNLIVSRRSGTASDPYSYEAYRVARSGLALGAPGTTTLLADLADSAGNPYALHASAGELDRLYRSGQAAFLLNTGALTRPLTKAEYQQGLTRPANLFSHSDQTTQAFTAQSEATTSGWGGRLLDVFGPGDPLSAVSVSSHSVFLEGIDVRSNVIPPGSSLALAALSGLSADAADARRQALNAMVLMDGGHPLREAANGQFASGLQLADTLQLSGNLPTLSVTFPNTGLGNQLREVARLIRIRSTMGPGRQVFFCSMGGFDTHTGQLGTHSSLLLQLSQGLGAFTTAMQDLGLGANVTAFTQSEFNRTFQFNGSGSDHAWGGHQVVLGGAVRGGIYGSLPQQVLGGPDDVGTRGMFIPTTSSAQVGATLGRWFGASESELATAFPTLANFPTSNLGFMA